MMNDPQIKEYLDLPFIKDLPEIIVRSLVNLSVFRSYIPGKMIIHQSEPCQSAYLVLHGNVNIVCLSSNGRRYVLSNLGPGDWFNAITCLNFIEFNPASAVAMTPVKMLAITCHNFRKLNSETPEFSRKLMENISDRTIHLTKKLEDLALLSVSGRVADFLLTHADNDGLIYWQCTQNDIANRLGTVAEVVGRTLRTFADEGIIIMPERNCILIKNFEGLRQKTLK